MNAADNRGEAAAGGRDGPVRCEDVQAVLFDYMARELGPGRSDLVREHLRKCRRCQAAAEEVQATLDLLRRASESDEEGIPERLSDERRRRLVWAYTHPVMHWIERHHILVSVTLTLIVVALALAVLRRTELWPRRPAEGVSVIIGEPGGAPLRTNRTDRTAP